MTSSIHVAVTNQWLFEVYGHGASRVSTVSLQTVPYIKEKHFWVNVLFDQYAQSIKQIGFNVEGEPLAVCLKFSEWIMEKKMHTITKLDLFKDKKILILPPQMGLFRNLKELDLSGNQLRRLFPELPFLKTLEILDVSGNPLSGLQDLSQLPKLHTIRANNCGLVEIPDWMNKSQSLKYIELKGNHIGRAPEWFEEKKRMFRLSRELSCDWTQSAF